MIPSQENSNFPKPKQLSTIKKANQMEHNNRSSFLHKSKNIQENPPECVWNNFQLDGSNQNKEFDIGRNAPPGMSKRITSFERANNPNLTTIRKYSSVAGMCSNSTQTKEKSNSSKNDFLMLTPKEAQEITTKQISSLNASNTINEIENLKANSLYTQNDTQIQTNKQLPDIQSLSIQADRDTYQGPHIEINWRLRKRFPNPPNALKFCPFVYLSRKKNNVENWNSDEEPNRPNILTPEEKKAKQDAHLALLAAKAKERDKSIDQTDNSQISLNGFKNVKSKRTLREEKRAQKIAEEEKSRRFHKKQNEAVPVPKSTSSPSNRNQFEANNDFHPSRQKINPNIIETIDKNENPLKSWPNFGPIVPPETSLFAKDAPFSETNETALSKNGLTSSFSVFGDKQSNLTHFSNFTSKRDSKGDNSLFFSQSSPLFMTGLSDEYASNQSRNVSMGCLTVSSRGVSPVGKFTPIDRDEKHVPFSSRSSQTSSFVNGDSLGRMDWQSPSVFSRELI